MGNKHFEKGGEPQDGSDNTLKGSEFWDDIHNQYNVPSCEVMKFLKKLKDELLPCGSTGKSSQNTGVIYKEIREKIDEIMGVWT